MLISGNWHREVVRRMQAVALLIVRFADMRFTYGTGQRFGSLGNSFSRDGWPLILKTGDET
jgi:hypothetical protein